MTIVDPRVTANSNSSNEASKLGEAKCAVFELLSTWCFFVCSAIRHDSPECVTTTPLGVPVDPEV